jgi:monovalent cation:H+ antiporter-2, CPA2 family
MMELPHDFLRDLAVVLGVAAITTVLSQLLRLPVVLGYLLAGVIVGPETGVPLFADRERIRELAELGVILLMFSIGLEFSFRHLSRVAPRAGLVALVEIGLTFFLGAEVAGLFGGDGVTRLMGGAIVCISSTMIVAHTFQHMKVDPPVRDLVIGVLIMEDVAALMLIAVLTAVAAGGGAPSFALAAHTGGRLLLFLAGTAAVGIVVVPRLFRYVVALRRKETLLVASVGLCFSLALLARAEGFSVALGAFVAGALLAEAGVGRRVEPLVEPLRDIFGGIFFVAAGMLLQPYAALQAWPVIVALTAVVLVGKSLGVSAGAFLSGQPVRVAVQSGMSLTQIGEFSFVMAAAAPAATLIGGTPLFTVAVAVAVLTSAVSPFLIRASERIALAVDARLPRPMQTFVSLYASWLELVFAPGPRTPGNPVRRGVATLALDGALIAAIVAGASFNMRWLAAWVTTVTGAAERNAQLLVLAGALVVALPFGIGIVSVARRLGVRLAERALPLPQGRAVDQGRSPRRTLAGAIQLGIVSVVGLLLLALSQPLLPGISLPLLFALGFTFLALAFWRSATDLQGHVTAGAEVALHVLERPTRRAHSTEEALAQVERLLPGIGSLAPVTITAASAAAGHTLAELNLRGLTGATVVAVAREGEPKVYPDGHERIEAGDVLALTGSHAAVAAAVEMLGKGREGSRE